ncbi:hypothetical protein D3C84_505800 [compost metagenome]
MPCRLAGLGVGGDLVLGVAVLGQQGLAGFLDVPENVVLGHHGRLVPEHGIRLHRQLVPGQVGRALGDGKAQIAEGILDGLVRQAVHQVQVEVGETGGARHVGGADGLVTVVDAPQGLELFRLEALHADRQAVDAQRPVVAELGLLEGAGVGFQGDFDIAGEGYAPFHAFEQTAQGLGREQAGGAAAEEDRAQRPAMHSGQVLVEVGEQGVDVLLFRQRRPGGVGVEVAVGALLHAPGDVDIQRQGRQLEAASGKLQAVRGALACGLRLTAWGCCFHIPNRCLSRAMARARWLSWFFSAAGSSALEQSRSSTQNSGS